MKKIWEKSARFFSIFCVRQPKTQFQACKAWQGVERRRVVSNKPVSIIGAKQL
ncbi:MAG: hypothetical protein KAI67_00045 [Candidatus Pacebacteria bacterium]|nr:hypothetical protein [Candidatus Paceibacterota bacterium]